MPTATRAGPVHSFAADSPVPRSAYAAHPPGPVPVVVRSAREAGVIGRGEMTASFDPADPDTLLGSIAWDEAIETRAGDSEPTAHCEFGPDGRLVRVVVELDEPDPSGPDEPDHAAGCCPSCDGGGPCDDHPDHTNDPEGGGPRGGPDPGDHERRQAEMAADDQRDEKAADPSRQQANPDRNAAAAPAPDGPDELARELAKLKETLKETNRKAAADRKFREDREDEERKKKDQELPEIDRLKAARDEAARRAGEDAARADRAEAELVRMRVDLEIERIAREARFTYPDLVAAMLDRDRIEFDDDTGRPINLARLVKDLAEKRPALLDSSRGGGTPQRTPPAPRQGVANANPNGVGPSAPDRVSELRGTVRYGL